MNEEIATLKAELARAQASNRALEERLQALVDHFEAFGAGMFAVKTLLQAVVDHSPNRDQIVRASEALIAMLQVQPGILGTPAADTPRRMKQELDWMTKRP